MKGTRDQHRDDLITGLYDLYLSEGVRLTQRQISRACTNALGKPVSQTTVRRVLMQHGIEFTPLGRRPDAVRLFRHEVTE